MVDSGQLNASLALRTFAGSALPHCFVTGFVPTGSHENIARSDYKVTLQPPNETSVARIGRKLHRALQQAQGDIYKEVHFLLRRLTHY